MDDQYLDLLFMARDYIAKSINDHLTVEELRRERDYYRDKYFESTSQSIQHSEAMMGQILSSLISKAQQ